MTAAATLASMHAERIVEARRLEAIAARRAEDDPAGIQAADLASGIRTEAADLASGIRTEAAALAVALKAMGVELPDPRQLSLLNIPEGEDA